MTVKLQDKSGRRNRMNIHEYAGLKIATSYANSPIPTRSFDWVAYVDNWGDDGPHYGYGETEHEAIAELLETLEEME